MGVDFREWMRRLGEALALLRPILTHADDRRRLVKLAAGEETHAWGAVAKATAPSMLLVGLSRDSVTIAVLDGSIMLDEHNVRPGDAVVRPLEGGKTKVLRFNARRLAATLPARWLADADTTLAAISERQRRQRFWGS